MIDPIIDMLNQIRNGEAVNKADVSVPYSNFKNEIANLLAKEGFVGEIKKATKGRQKVLKIALKYDNGVPAIAGLKRVSKQGQRIYANLHEIKKVKGGHGFAIISTSKGLMTDKDAKKNKLGGEVICEIW